jgi:hypothetical protein
MTGTDHMRARTCVINRLTNTQGYEAVLRTYLHGLVLDDTDRHLEKRLQREQMIYIPQEDLRGVLSLFLVNSSNSSLVSYDFSGFWKGCQELEAYTFQDIPIQSSGRKRQPCISSSR